MQKISLETVTSMLAHSGSEHDPATLPVGFCDEDGNRYALASAEVDYANNRVDAPLLMVHLRRA